MLLHSATIGPFKSINEEQSIKFDPEVTVLVGMNEAGKTVVLQALEKSDDAIKIAVFSHIDDYPRKDLLAYLKRHETNPEEATELTYRLDNDEVASVNEKYFTDIKNGFTFSHTHRYNNKLTVAISVNEEPVIQHLALTAKDLGTDAQNAIRETKSLRDIPEKLKGLSLTDAEKTFVALLEARIGKTKWENVVAFEVHGWLTSHLPPFLYFGDYDLLPGKMNLADLASRVEQAKANSKVLTPKHRAVLGLLRMADITVGDFLTSAGYEALKAKMEGVSIALTDQVMEFWKQNENLDVEVDIKADPSDEAPFNNGPNLYLRIRNRRHRGVSTSFDQRSRGFIWFFSFLVWFNDVQQQIDPVNAVHSERRLVLLLDEPGLALHALAQADFLNYIDHLSHRHQVIYTTHSPFMVRHDRLHQVRLVMDKENIGTVVTDNISSSDSRTIFPLQAALGWNVAQNLFIHERNLLVEGASELILLQAISERLETAGRPGLSESIAIVPVGGLGNLVSFIALLGANGLKIAVLHDFRGTPEQKLIDLVKERLVSDKAILNVSMFRDLTKIGENTVASDTEDIISADRYLAAFSRTFAKQLPQPITVADLPPGHRIIDRLERLLVDRKISLRPSGGYNHYSVAARLVKESETSLDEATLNRFAALIQRVNHLLV